MAVIVTGAMLLSLFWVILVPIYQAPDEDSHLDYAFTILRHGGLISAGAGPMVQIADPYTAYLVKRTHLNSVAFHPAVPMPRQYGTPAYFAGVDRDAPRGGHSAGVPFLATVYPFGYYALVAAFIAPVHAITGSLIATVFAARILSVLLLGLTLVFVQAALGELGYSRRFAVLFTAIVGFFPLTSFVSSYVQPDNLGATLVWLCLLLALRL